MKLLELFYPVRPHIVNRVWGYYAEDTANPGHSIYEPFGFKLHNGVDLNLVNGQEIRAPFDCQVVRTGTRENGLWQPKGGGIFIGLLSKNMYDFPDGKSCNVLVDFLHCEKLLVKDGQQVLVGEVIALGDNTGFTTGAHTHVQFRRVTWVNKVITDVDKNDANNSFNPDPYWTKIYADTFPKVAALKRALAELLAAFQNLFVKRSEY